MQMHDKLVDEYNEMDGADPEKAAALLEQIAILEVALLYSE